MVRMSSNADTPDRPDQPWQPAGGSEPVNPYGATPPAYTPPPQAPYTAPAQAPYGAPAQAPYGAPDPYAAQQPYPPAPPQVASSSTTPPAMPRQDANPLAALFDFGFTKFATPGIVKVIYLLSVIGAGLGWLFLVVSGFSMGRLAGGGAGAGVVALLFGWIPALLSIAYVRFILEAVVALIRIHDRVSEIAARREGGPR